MWGNLARNLQDQARSAGASALKSPSSLIAKLGDVVAPRDDDDDYDDDYYSDEEYEGEEYEGEEYEEEDEEYVGDDEDSGHPLREEEEEQYGERNGSLGRRTWDKETQEQQQEEPSGEESFETRRRPGRAFDYTDDNDNEDADAYARTRFAAADAVQQMSSTPVAAAARRFLGGGLSRLAAGVSAATTPDDYHHDEGVAVADADDYYGGAYVEDTVAPVPEKDPYVAQDDVAQDPTPPPPEAAFRTGHGDLRVTTRASERDVAGGVAKERPRRSRRSAETKTRESVEEQPTGTTTTKTTATTTTAASRRRTMKDSESVSSPSLTTETQEKMSVPSRSYSARRDEDKHASLPMLGRGQEAAETSTSSRKYATNTRSGLVVPQLKQKQPPAPVEEAAATETTSTSSSRRWSSKKISPAAAAPPPKPEPAEEEEESSSGPLDFAASIAMAARRKKKTSSQRKLSVVASTADEEKERSSRSAHVNDHSSAKAVETPNVVEQLVEADDRGLNLKPVEGDDGRFKPTEEEEKKEKEMALVEENVGRSKPFREDNQRVQLVMDNPQPPPLEVKESKAEAETSRGVLKPAEETKSRRSGRSQARVRFSNEPPQEDRPRQLVFDDDEGPPQQDWREETQEEEEEALSLETEVCAALERSEPERPLEKRDEEPKQVVEQEEEETPVPADTVSQMPTSEDPEASVAAEEPRPAGEEHDFREDTVHQEKDEATHAGVDLKHGQSTAEQSPVVERSLPPATSVPQDNTALVDDGKLAALESQCTTLQGQLSAAEELIAQLRREASQKEATMKRQGEQNNEDNRMEVEDLRRRLEQQDEQIMRLAQSKAEEADERGRLEAAASESAAAAESLEAELEQLQKTWGERCAGLEGELDEVRLQKGQESAQLRRLLDEATARATEAEGEIKSLSAKHKSAMAQSQQRQSRTVQGLEERLEKVTTEKDKEIRKFKGQLSDLKKQMAESKEGVEQAEEEMDELHDENEELRERVAHLEEEQQELKKEIASLESERGKAKELQVELQKVKDSRDRETAQIQSAAESASSTHAKVAAERDAALAEARDLERQLAAAMADVELARADCERAVTSSNNLQKALEAFGSERDAEVSLLGEQRQVEQETLQAAHEAALEATKEANELQMKEVQLAADQAIRNMMDEIKNMEHTSEQYRKETINLRRSLDEAISRLQRNQEDVIDRSLIKNILLDWHSKSGKARRDVMMLLANVLHFTEEEKDKANVGVHSGGAGTLGKVVDELSTLPPPSVDPEKIQGDNMREKWVNFLLSEAGED